MSVEGAFLTGLARRTIERWTTSRSVEPVPDEVPESLRCAAACFVSIKTDSGDLRGCMGTLEPMCASLAEEVIKNAVSACSEDPRFPPVGSAETASLRLSVDVLSVPEEVLSVAELNPDVYGIIVRSGYRRGVLLPDLQGVETVAHQIGIAMQKAGIPLDTDMEDVELFRFTVRRFPESI